MSLVKRICSNPNQYSIEYVSWYDDIYFSSTGIKSLSLYRIEVGIDLIVEIDDNIAAKSYFIAIGSKLIELVNERLLTLYDDIVVGFRYQVFEFVSY